jgi:excisionase family DNA binding protein
MHQMAPRRSYTQRQARQLADTDKHANAPIFYTVREAARLLRCDPATLYRAIREDAFPAVRLRTRYVVPAKAIDQLASQAIETGSVVDVAKIAAERRTERELKRLGY